MSQVQMFINLMSHINWYKIWVHYVHYVHLPVYITIFQVLINVAPSIYEYSAARTYLYCASLLQLQDYLIYYQTIKITKCILPFFRLYCVWYFNDKAVSIPYIWTYICKFSWSIKWFIMIYLSCLPWAQTTINSLRIGPE